MINKYRNLTTGNIVNATKLNDFSYSNVYDVIRIDGQNVNNDSFIESEKFSDFCYYCKLDKYVKLKDSKIIRPGQYIVNEDNKTCIYNQYSFERLFKKIK